MPSSKHTPYLICLAALGIVGGWFFPPAHASDRRFTIAEIRATYEACVARMPSSQRVAFQAPGRRTRMRIEGAVRKQWQECRERERDWADAVAIDALRADLVRLVSHAEAEAEALAIATVLVQTTRAQGTRYRMVGSPLFNNFLIRIGAKERGYCYHWTEALFKSLPPVPGEYYERHWGGANVGRMTENNGVVITARGAPVASGIVYDAWRGAGRPWWTWVRDDHYPWMERYNEQEILSGHITFVED